ncbi:putative flagellar protein FliS [Clostridium sp. CAG:167]|nr:putative flagellar protein FliS [Clostridium sp. CAG:167]
MTDSQGLWFNDNLVSQSYVSLKNTVVVESGVKSNTLQDLYASIPEGVTEKEAIKAVETAGDLCKVDVSAKTVDTVLKAAYDEAMEDNFIWLSGAVLIISFVMIATITLMSARIYERKKEIGIRRAVGYTSGRLAVLFTQELFFVGVLAWLTEGIYAWYVYGQSQDGSVEFSQGQFGLPLFFVSGLFVVIQIIPACIFAMRQMGKMQPQKLIGGSE